jgi:YidC/Oxa1 family membrane protein insertase
MENRRFILIAMIGVILFFIYQAWQKELVPATATAAVATAAASAVSVDEAPRPAAVNAETLSAPTATNRSARIQVQTDVFNAEIALNGGELRKVELTQYPAAKEHPEQKFAFLDDRGDHPFVLQSGLATPEQTLSGPQTVYTAAQTHYQLATGTDTLDVPLQFVDASGYSITKTYRFKRGSYDIELLQEVKNDSATELSVSPYVRLWRTPPPPAGHSMMGGTNTFSGIGFYERKPDSDSYRFKKIKFEDLAKEPLQVQQPGGWMAVMQHYFIAAIIPPVGGSNTYSGKPSSAQGYLAQVVGAATPVAAQGTHQFSTQIYVGPLLQKTIGAVAPGLELAVDYGILTPIAEPLFWLLDKFHKLTHNWGFAIILLTLSVKGAMYKLSEAQYRSMAKMKKFAPRIQEMKERYADDRERMSKAMMELYKKEGFNPLAGCWPLLVQFPVFIALYWVLLESVELRQAPFILWVNDLSAADPYFVLPVLFGISMFVQQKLSGQQMPDPMQQRIMSIMPIIMTAFFAFFPSGLVLYWFVSNLTGITQQWFITKRLDKEGLGKKAA